MKRPVLVTGFEPFGGMSGNPSAELAQCLGGTSERGREIVGGVLPVEFERSGRLLRDWLAAHHPEVVVCLGVAASRRVMSLERVAVNLDDARIADNAGRQPIDRPVVAGGPDAFFTRLPVKAIWQRWREVGVPAEVSPSAGTYVCNHVFYHLMEALTGEPDVRAGFVHVPLPRRGLSLAKMEAALRELIRISLRRRRDLRVSAGRED